MRGALSAAGPGRHRRCLAASARERCSPAKCHRARGPDPFGFYLPRLLRTPLWRGASLPQSRLAREGSAVSPLGPVRPWDLEGARRGARHPPLTRARGWPDGQGSSPPLPSPLTSSAGGCPGGAITPHSRKRCRRGEARETDSFLRSGRYRPRAALLSNRCFSLNPPFSEPGLLSNRNRSIPASGADTSPPHHRGPASPRPEAVLPETPPPHDQYQGVSKRFEIWTGIDHDTAKFLCFERRGRDKSELLGKSEPQKERSGGICREAETAVGKHIRHGLISALHPLRFSSTYIRKEGASDVSDGLFFRWNLPRRESPPP